MRLRAEPSPASLRPACLQAQAHPGPQAQTRLRRPLPRPPAAGRLTGQAAGLLYRARSRFFQFAEETEMTKARAKSARAPQPRLPSPPADAPAPAPAPAPALAPPPTRPCLPRPLACPPSSCAAASGGAGHHVPAARHSVGAAGRHQHLSAGVSERASERGGCWCCRGGPALCSSRARRHVARPRAPLRSSLAVALNAAAALCRPIAQRVLSVRPQPGHESSAAADPLAASGQPAAGGGEQQQQLQALQLQLQALQQQQATHAQRPAGSFAASAVQAAPAAAAPRRQQAAAAAAAATPGEQHPLTMPVSAVAAGWAPDRTGQAPSSSGQRRCGRRSRG